MLYQHKSTILLVYYYFTTAYMCPHTADAGAAESKLDKAENVESKKIKIKVKIKK